jgi:hypothetical protein
MHAVRVGLRRGRDNAEQLICSRLYAAGLERSGDLGGELTNRASGCPVLVHRHHATFLIRSSGSSSAQIDRR